MQCLLATAAFLTLSAVLATALPGSGTLTLTPATTTENRLSIRISVSYNGLPPATVSGGQNPLPVGTAGEITVQLSAPAGRRFVRMAAIQP